MKTATGVEQVWERRNDLDNWRYHVSQARGFDDPHRPHEAAEYGFKLACSLSKYVATPWAIDLAPTDVIALAGMILDPKVPA